MILDDWLNHYARVGYTIKMEWSQKNFGTRSMTTTVCFATGDQSTSDKKEGGHRLVTPLFFLCPRLG